MIKSQKRLEQAKAILRLCKEKGATEIVVRFDGSGDSGSIDEVYIDLKEPLIVEYDEESTRYDGDKWVTTSTTKQVPLRDALEQITYDMLEKTGIDWYNNDGGYGELNVDLVQGTIQLEVNSRYTEVTTDTFELDTNFAFTD